MLKLAVDLVDQGVERLQGHVPLAAGDSLGLDDAIALTGDEDHGDCEHDHDGRAERAGGAGQDPDAATAAVAARFQEVDFPPERREIGLMFQDFALFPHLTALQNVQFGLKPLGKEAAQAEALAWLGRLGLTQRADAYPHELSGGEQQRVAIARALAPKPAAILMDEPFSGLDPVNTNLLKDEIHQLHNEGVSIIFSTHRMEQVEEVCEHIVLINKGKNVLEGRVKDIKNRFKRNRFRIDYEGDLPPGLEQRADIVEQSDHSIIIQVDEEGRSNELLQYLLQNGVFVHAFNEILPTLNEIFIRQVKG